MFAEFPATRWSLIARLPDQPQAAATLLGLYVDAVGVYLTGRLRGEQVDRIDDVVQEVLVQLLERPQLLAQAQPGEGSRFRYYLMRVAWNSAQNILRHQRRRDHGPLTAATESATDESPAATDAMDRAWALSLVQQAMDEVHAAAQDGRVAPEAPGILAENLIEGRGLREIAAARKLSLATCSRRLAQARQCLQQALAERLRAAGEIGADEDAASAGERLLAALRGT